MRVYILGIDGYIGWPLYEYLVKKGHEVLGCDNFRRRTCAKSLTPTERDSNLIHSLNIHDNDALTTELAMFKPDAIVHLAEEPSAPYSMMGVGTAIETQVHNITGTISLVYAVRSACPNAHIVKIGTLGEYMPSSWYHLSKVHDTNNLKWAAKTWNLKVTDIMQGPVYGVGGRYDYDDKWGTVINRFVAQAVAGIPLSIYGDGSQVRGFLPIADSIQCLEIILRNRTQGKKSYLALDQFAEATTITSIAAIVSRLTGCEIANLRNPRVESIKAEDGLGNKWLLKHGYVPQGNLYTNIQDLIDLITPFKDDIDVERFAPKVNWRA